MNTVTGTIMGISAPETLQSGRGTQYTKQSVFLDCASFNPQTGERYPNDLLLDFINRREGDIAAQFKNGDRVTVSFYLRGRSWDSRREPGKKEYGVSVSCFRIEAAPLQGQTPAAPAQPAPQNYGGGTPAAPAPQAPAPQAYAPQAPAPQAVGVPF